MTDAELTRALALLGAATSILALLVSLVSLAWTIWRDIRDTGRPQITLMVGQMLQARGLARPAIRSAPAGSSPGLDYEHLFVFVTNAGRQPITIAKIGGFSGPRLGIRLPGFTWRRQGWVLHTRNLPKILQPTESVTEWFDDARDGVDIRVLYVWDSTGKGWRVSNRALRQIRKRIREGTADEPEAADQRESDAGDYPSDARP